MSVRLCRIIGRELHVCHATKKATAALLAVAMVVGNARVIRLCGPYSGPHCEGLFGGRGRFVFVGVIGGQVDWAEVPFGTQAFFRGAVFAQGVEGP